MRYTRESIVKILESKTHKLEYSVGLFEDNRIVGYVYGKVHRVAFNDIPKTVLSVNFLCVEKNQRKVGMASLMIEEIKRRAYCNEIYSAIFSGRDDRGFSFTTVPYYHLPINVEKLRDLIFLPKSYTGVEYRLRNNTIINPTVDHLMQMYLIYQNSNDNFTVYEKFGIEEFFYIMTPSPNCNYTLYNPNTREFSSFFIIDNLNSTNNTFIRKAYLYYWVGGDEIISDTFAYAKSLGIDMFDVLNMGRNGKDIIKKFNLLEGTGKLYYHLFNMKQKKKDSSEMNFILL